MTKYFTLTQLIIDDLYFPDGSFKLNQLGGGVYAVAGTRAFEPDVGFVCAAGPDYKDKFDQWFMKNKIDMAVALRPKPCVHSMITYFEDGERLERCQDGCGNYIEMMPQVCEIPDSFLNAKGFYFYKDCDEDYWAELRKYIISTSAVSCWEIDSRYATFEHRDNIAACLPHVDLFSLNLIEGRRLTNVIEPIKVAKRILDFGARHIALRMGSLGLLVADKKSIWQIPAYPSKVVDVTGGGNSCTGGFLVGFCESEGSILEAGLYGNVASSFIIEQFGVPNDMDLVYLKTKARKKKLEGLAELL